MPRKRTKIRCELESFQPSTPEEHRLLLQRIAENVSSVEQNCREIQESNQKIQTKWDEARFITEQAEQHYQAISRALTLDENGQLLNEKGEVLDRKEKIKLRKQVAQEERWIFALLKVLKKRLRR